jgi:hypothetical protein
MSREFETVRIGDLVIGRATYQPGWKWSEHVSPLAGTTRSMPTDEIHLREAEVITIHSGVK